MTPPTPPMRPTYILADEATVRIPRDPSLLAQAERIAQGYHQCQAAEASQWLKQGLAHLRKGQYTPALALLQQALQSYRNLGDKERQAKVLLTLAHLYYRVADYLWAADYGRQCLRVARELGDDDLMQQILGHLGNSYRHLGNLQRALEYMGQSLTIAKKIGDRPGEMRSLNNLAMVYRAKGLTRQAATLYEASLMMATTLGDSGTDRCANRTTKLQILQNLGNTYLTLREYAQAVNCYERLLSVSENGEGKLDTRTTRRVLTQLTLASIAMGDHNRAIVHLQHHLSIACALGDTKGAASLIDDLKRSYVALSEARVAVLRPELPSM
ncbi:tetratricopeptide repeat protein [Nodosilinea sp. LEGE 06152]|uniref:tetratricopeptide repeat protein n=1 Tax=Nodosilinea sp. LEGE 06152 TaxID=2777966 RepID=UPI00188074FB|nr:tetratricopeptide repeat protein [Nodosilinea sp. LEGE 06152]MBE9156652.1 tetratricopeptide repeat protein [Nodosilinea sp. LEGE 06152]MBE9160499.1 tetratricopeptide repeat protein [Nodosilinea sp. LEGE 06152]